MNKELQQIKNDSWESLLEYYSELSQSFAEWKKQTREDPYISPYADEEEQEQYYDHKEDPFGGLSVTDLFTNRSQ